MRIFTQKKFQGSFTGLSDALKSMFETFRRIFKSQEVINLKKITLLKIDGCPYCRQAFNAIEKLKSENETFATLNIEIIDNYSDSAKTFAQDYYYVPSMFVDGKKIYEAHPGETFDECFANVQKVFKAALQ